MYVGIIMLDIINYTLYLKVQRISYIYVNFNVFINSF